MSNLSPTHWQAHIEAWQQTPQSQAAYCRAHQLSQHQFSYWKRKLQSGVVEQHEVTCGFAVAQFETHRTAYSGLCVSLPNGAQLSEIDGANVHVALQLLAALR